MIFQVIKPASHHFNQWCGLYKEFMKPYPNAAEFGDDYYRLTWDGYFDDGRRTSCFLLLSGDDVVGFIDYCFHDYVKAAGTVCYIENLFMHPDFRKQGGARQLMDAVFAEAAMKKCYRTYWITMENNLEAQSLYRQMGTEKHLYRYAVIHKEWNE